MQNNVTFLEQENKQIAEFLNYYIMLKTPPNYAVLLDGQWGSGKTFFINKIREIYETEERKIIYVSLFGITSVNQIDDQIYNQFYTIGKKYLRYGAKVITSVIKSKLAVEVGDAMPFVDSLGDIDPTKLQPKIDNAIFVFDDFERSGISNREAIGYINNFVEHGNNKVLVVANTQEIDKSEEFLRTFEKVIGRTFKILPEFDSAFDTFAKIISEPDAAAELVRQKSAIREIFKNANHKNLRTLKYVQTEIERMFKLIPEPNRTPEYLSHIVGSISRACIELKSGNLSANELSLLTEHYHQGIQRGIVTSINGKGKEAEAEGLDEQDRLGKIYERIFGKNMYVAEPSLDFMTEFFEFGMVRNETIQTMIQNSRFFQDKNIQDWEYLWDLWDIEPNELKARFEIVFQNFKDEKFTNQKELVQVCSILLYLAKHRLVKITHSLMNKEVQKVLKKMKARRKISLETEGQRPTPRFFDSYKGKGFLDRESTEVQEIIRGIISYEKNTAALNAKDDAIELLTMMKDNPRGFFDSLTTTRSVGKFAKHPVLLQIDPSAFVSKYLEVSSTSKNEVDLAFSERFKTHSLDSPLVTELPWLQKIQKKNTTKSKKIKNQHCQK